MPYRVWIAAAVLIVAASCSDAESAKPIANSTASAPAPLGTQPVPAPTAGTQPTTTIAPYTSSIYADPAHWICRADLADVCDGDVAITDVAADGTLTRRTSPAAVDAPVDCFYIYPTSSEDPSINSDLVPGREIAVTQTQAGPFSQVCSVYAPVYRSVTLDGLFGGQAGEAEWDAGYQDVADAWKHYLANDNHGRGVILVSHSQGSINLARLLSEQIDPDAAQRDLLVGAYAMGIPAVLPVGDALDADLQHIPLCHALDQTGCVVAYATFDAASPPGADSYFGRPRSGASTAGLTDECVNPAAPAGGSAELSSTLTSGSWALDDNSAQIDTPFMNLPGFVTAECVERNGISYLEVTFHPDPDDPRVDALNLFDLGPQWGLHIVDVQIAGGSLVEMARRQIAAYTSSS